MNNAVQRALELATSKELAMRNPLPLNFLEYMGSGRGPIERKKEKREQFQSEMMTVFETVKESLAEAMHAAADEMGMEFTSCRLPPSRDADLPDDMPELTPETKVAFSNPKYLQIVESWQYEESEPEMPPMMAFLPPQGMGPGGIEPEVAKITDSDSEIPVHQLTSDDDKSISELPEPHAPEAPGDDDPPPAFFWLFDSHCNTADNHMMVSDNAENPPLQIDDIFRPLILHLIENWQQPAVSLHHLSDEFDVEFDCVKELLSHFVNKGIATLSKS